MSSSIQKINGSNNIQTNAQDGSRVNIHSGTPPPTVTEADRSALRELLAALKTEVEATAPQDQKAAALGQIDNLTWAATSEQPEPGTISAVKKWFDTPSPRFE